MRLLVKALGVAKDRRTGGTSRLFMDALRVGRVEGDQSRPLAASGSQSRPMVAKIRPVAASRGQWQPVALPLGLEGALLAGLEGVGAGRVGAVALLAWMEEGQYQPVAAIRGHYIYDISS